MTIQSGADFFHLASAGDQCDQGTLEQNGQQSVTAPAPALIVIITTNLEGDSLGSNHIRLG